AGPAVDDELLRLHRGAADQAPERGRDERERERPLGEKALERKDEHGAERDQGDERCREPRARSAAVDPDGEADEEQRREAEEVALREVVDMPGGEDADLDDRPGRERGGDGEVGADGTAALAAADRVEQEQQDGRDREERAQEDEVARMPDDLAPA